MGRDREGLGNGISTGVRKRQEKGHEGSMPHLCFQYEKGEGTEKDLKMAFTGFRKQQRRVMRVNVWSWLPYNTTMMKGQRRTWEWHFTESSREG
ncbi:unnamed protein product [Rhizophagus irregularis]|nr:unnamed protein product [Rhizophagus irregularis]